MLSNSSHGTLMSYTDHSVHRRFKSNTPIIFKTTRRLQAGEFYQGWTKSLQECGLEGSMDVKRFIKKTE